MQITATAPGKVVLAGEYAVLLGAPALVMAVDRYAICRLSSDESGDTKDAAAWQFESQGFDAASRHSLAQLNPPQALSPQDPARLCAFVLQAMFPNQPFTEKLPAALMCHTDTRAMYLQQPNLDPQKLGLGSSAAALIATYGALCRLQGTLSPEFTIANAAHRASQGGIGSGLDLAASLQGGLLRFEQGRSQPGHWPTNLHYRFIYVGRSASTGQLVSRFYRWCDGGTPATVQILINAALKLADEAINLDNFDRYIHALIKMDEAAMIGIHSLEHQYVATAAQRHGVLYKPCGAGGGDLGVALSDDPSKLRQLTKALARDHKNDFAIIELEIATHGLTLA